MPSALSSAYQTKGKLMLIPLQFAYLCGNDHVTSNSVECECGSRSLVSLAKILDRDTTDRAEEFVELATRWEN